MFLEVVTNPRNISGDFDPIGQSHSGNLSKGGIRFFGSGCVDSYANPSFLGRSRESGGRSLPFNPFPSLSNQLTNRRHLPLSKQPKISYFKKLEDIKQLPFLKWKNFTNLSDFFLFVKHFLDFSKKKIETEEETRDMNNKKGAFSLSL
jgi:hypothetical protein